MCKKKQLFPSFLVGVTLTAMLQLRHTWSHGKEQEDTGKIARPFIQELIKNQESEGDVELSHGIKGEDGLGS